MRTCSSIVIPGIRAELANEILMTSAGDIFGVVSVLFIFGFKVTDVVCV